MKITAQDPNPFSLAELKAAMRVEHSAEDDVISRYADTALDFFERVTDHYLRSTTLQGRFAESPIEVTARPFVEVVTAKDDDGADVTLTTTDTPSGTFVFEWDSSADGACTITWTVGESSRGAIPATSAQAVRVLVSDCYVHRNLEHHATTHRAYLSSAVLLGESRNAL